MLTGCRWHNCAMGVRGAVGLFPCKGMPCSQDVDGVTVLCGPRGAVGLFCSEGMSCLQDVDGITGLWRPKNAVGLFLCNGMTVTEEWISSLLTPLWERALFNVFFALIVYKQ